MKQFRYRGRRRGEIIAGEFEAVSSEAVAARLAGVGIVPVEIVPVQQGGDAGDFLRAQLRSRGVSLEDLIILTRQLHATERAGLPIIKALRAIGETSHSARLAEALDDVAEGLESGLKLATALQRHPRVFSSLFVSTMQVGEETGNFERAFAQLSVYLELERETRRRIKSATRYPMLVLGAVGVALVILNVFALPVFAEIFAEFGADVPWATRVLIASSDLSQRYWPHACVATLALAIGLRLYVRTESGRLRWDRFKLRVPIVGRILEKAVLARFARTLALSLRSGVSIIHGLTVSARVVENEHVATHLHQLRQSVERGETLARSASASRLFTPLVLRMIEVGEETGALDDMLQQVADFYDDDVDYELKRLGDSIEPILIVGVGIVVLILALGVYLPMWDLAQVSRGG